MIISIISILFIVSYIIFVIYQLTLDDDNSFHHFQRSKSVFVGIIIFCILAIFGVTTSMLNPVKVTIKIVDVEVFPNSCYEEDSNFCIVYDDGNEKLIKKVTIDELKEMNGGFFIVENETNIYGLENRYINYLKVY